MTGSENTVWHSPTVQKTNRNALNRHGSGIIWFTGLSAVGKSTIAHELENRLHQQGIRTYVLDGDNIRQGLNQDLKFSEADRRENIRRVAEVARLLADAGLITMAAYITPLNSFRQFLKHAFVGQKYLEIYVTCSLEECIKRDPKGLYKKALAGEIKNYTGVSAPFEEPESPDLTIDTGALSLEESVQSMLALLEKKEFLKF